MKLIINLLVATFIIIVTAYLLPGVHVDSFTAALVAAIVLGIINLLVKPLLTILTLPITILTLGLFRFVINAVLILLASSIVPGFKVDGFWWALIFSIVYSLISSFVNSLDRKT